MTPRLTAGVIGAVILATGATALYWKGRLEGAVRERPKLEAARAQATIAGLETRGERESAARVDAAVRTRVAATRSIIRITHDAQTSEDAHAPLAPLALLACALMTSSCAPRLPASPAAPRLEMPPEARRACELHRLPPAPTQADLEVGYATRGAQIVACDAVRRLGVETLDAEHVLEEEARKHRP